MSDEEVVTTPNSNSESINGHGDCGGMPSKDSSNLSAILNQSQSSDDNDNDTTETGSTVIENNGNANATANNVEDISLDDKELGDKASDLKEHDVIDEELSQANKVKESIDEELLKNDGWEKILGNDQLLKKVIKAGVPNKRPLRGEVCTIRLEGQLQDNEDVVFESYEKYSFQLGDAEVISALDLSIPLMCKGEIAHVKAASRFGYGTKGLEPLVPPNSNLFYEIELIDFENEKELEEMSITERREVGIKKRERGNWWYRRDEDSLAIQCYRRALEFMDEIEGGVSFPGESEAQKEETSRELKELIEERLKTLNNMAAAQMRIKAYEPALTSVDSVLRCQPLNVKALFRKGKILSDKGDVEKALEVLKRASELEPSNKSVLQEIYSLTSRRAKERQTEKKLYQRMFKPKQGELTSGSTSSRRHSTSSIKRTFGVGLVVGAVAILLGVGYRYRFM